LRPCEGKLPIFPGENVIHKNFEDLAEFRGSEKEIMRKVRQVRDEIKEYRKHLEDDECSR